jgi:inosine-uridine nucleoside N-ribohydrolase
MTVHHATTTKGQAPVTMDLLIDTDPGMGTVNSDPEDSFAVTYAANSPEAALRTVTVVQGNVPLRHGYANAAHLLELLGRDDVQLAAGASLPLAGRTRRVQQTAWLDEKDRWPRLLPATDGPYPGLSAVEAIRGAVEARPGMTVVAIGPLTNVAAAITAYPHLTGLIGKLVVMGGVFFEPGNVIPTAEFNFYMDPEAAGVVLDSGMRPVLVGLDVCHRTHLTRMQMKEAQSGTALGAFMEQACEQWFTSMENQGRAGLHLFDSLAVAAALQPDLITTEPAWVAVETQGQYTSGTSVAWLDGRPSAWSRPTREINADVAVDVDVERFTALFTDRVLRNL